MKYKELQGQTKESLTALLSELRMKLSKLNVELGDKKLKDVSQLSKVKKDIARVLTALQKEQEDN
jgi:large subunit ribosomal protein L29